MNTPHTLQPRSGQIQDLRQALRSRVQVRAAQTEALSKTAQGFIHGRLFMHELEGTAFVDAVDDASAANQPTNLKALPKKDQVLIERIIEEERGKLLREQGLQV